MDARRRPRVSQAHRREVEYREWYRSDASGRNDREGDDVLSLYISKLPYHVRPSSATGQMMVNDAAMLES